ncbi:hypothetical protein [Novosphingobium panipatense]|uniref:hypothetical protein n=1 Tax=Novosphingobium panipatense TaxID=428991 RepID=UPI003607C058
MTGADRLSARWSAGIGRIFAVAVAMAAWIAPIATQAETFSGQNQVAEVQNSFDDLFGTDQRGPRTYASPSDSNWQPLPTHPKGASAWRPWI